LKCRTKKKASAVLSELRKTGGGINEADPLSDLELRSKSLSFFDKKVIRLIGATALTGIKCFDSSSAPKQSQDFGINDESIESNDIMNSSLHSSNSMSLDKSQSPIEVIEIPTHSESRKRKFEINQSESDSIASKMLKTQIEIKNALLEFFFNTKTKVRNKTTKTGNFNAKSLHCFL